MSSLCQVRADTNLVIETFFSICVTVSFRSKPNHGLRSRIVGVRSTEQSAGIKVGAKASTFDYNNYFPCCTCWISSNCSILSNYWISGYQHYFFDCHKDIALALQLIHNKKCRLNTGSIFIMQQDNRLFKARDIFFYILKYYCL